MTCSICDCEILRVQLPSVANAGVNNSISTLPERSLTATSSQRLDMHRRKWEGKLSNLIDLHTAYIPHDVLERRRQYETAQARVAKCKGEV